MSLPFAADSVRLKSTELLSSIVTPDAPGLAGLVGSKAQARISGIGSSWVKFGALVTDWMRLSVSYQWFSVRDFGAVGDGVNNDAPAIQAAANAIAAAGGGILFFPTGDYKIQSQISLAAPCGISGQGSASKIVKSGTFQRAFAFTGASNARVANLCLDMASGAGEGPTAAGFTFTGCGDVWIEDCEIINTEGTGVVMTGCTRGTVIDSWFSNCDVDAISMLSMTSGGSNITRCVLDDATIYIDTVPGINVSETMMFFAAYVKDSIFISDSIAAVVSSSISAGSIFIESSRARIESCFINALTTGAIAVETDTLSMFSMGGNIVISDASSVGVQLSTSGRNYVNDNIILSTSNSRLFYSTGTTGVESFTDNMVIATAGAQAEMVRFTCASPAHIADNEVCSIAGGATTAIAYDGSGIGPTITGNFGRGQTNGVVLTGSYSDTPVIAGNQFDVTNGVTSSVPYCAGWSTSGSSMMVCSGDPQTLGITGGVGSFASNKAGGLGSALYAKDSLSWFPISGDVVQFSTDTIGTATAANWIPPNGGPMMPASTVGAVSVITRRVAKVVISTVAGVGAATITYDIRMNGFYVSISTTIANTFTGTTTITLASPVNFSASTILTVQVSKSAIVAAGQSACVMVVLI